MFPKNAWYVACTPDEIEGKPLGRRVCNEAIVFYRGPDGWMMASHVTRGASITVAKRERLFDASPYLANQYLVMYDVAADGRFLMLKLDPQPARTDVVIIRNWVQQVRARLTGSS